jgi:hypothetical protein
MRRALIVLAGMASVAALASAAANAGTVEVKFTKPETYADVRDNMMRRDEVLATFSDHLKKLGGRLPEGQTLQIEVLDIDLAGEVWPRSSRDIRVLRGRADWPRIKLAYTLRDGERVLRSGEEQLSDMNYMMSSMYLANGPYAYEMRMLDRWFDERILGAKP